MFKQVLNYIPRPWLIKLSYLVRPILDLSLRGSSFTDPINGKSYRKFLPYGYQNVRENVLAPGTLSLERHRLLWLYLKNETNFFKDPLKVLHFAPEQSFYNRFRKLPNITYTTTDLNSPLADVKADICDLPFENDTFDIIFCNHVLEHIPKDTEALQEMYRVMKPGGWGIFQVPQDLERRVTFEDNTITNKEERTAIFGQYDHVRIYGYDYFDKLRSAGFIVEEVDYTNSLPKTSVSRYRLAQGEIIPVVKKPKNSK